ncbi:MAG: MerR family transcriptional regulator [Acidobacteriaceae bacterium]
MTSHHPIRKVVTPEPTVIPDKLYFRIGDVAKLCDVPAYVLRFWETEFPQLKPNKGGTGQRLYRKRDVETALRIKSLLYDQGYTIPGARQVFSAEPKGVEPKVKDTTAESAPQLAATPAPVPTPEPAPTIDVGATIRERAQRRQQLTALRDELRSIADALSKPISSSHQAPAPAAVSIPEAPAARVKPMRPRLVLEPKPDAKSGPRRVDQGDLFPSE